MKLLFYCFQSDHTDYMTPYSAEAFHLPTSSSASDTHLSIFCTVPDGLVARMQCFHLQGLSSHQGRCVFWSSPGGASDKEPACQHRRYQRCGFDPWIRKIPWRRKWQPTPVFLPGESHGQRSLVGYSSRGCKESDMTEVTLHACISVFSLL